MLNKFLIPAVLVATVVIAGIFAFMPVEKASTVHGSITTGQTTTDTNVDAEMDAQDRTFTLSMNMSRDGSIGIYPMIPAKAGKTISGSYIIAVIPNNHTSGNAQSFGATTTFSCGLVDGQGNILSVPNGSRNVPGNGTLAPTAGRSVSVQYDRTNSNTGGVCNVYLFIDSISGE